MSIQLSELLNGMEAALPGLFTVNHFVEKQIDGVVEDSRLAAPGTIFVARAGTHANGAAFLQKALAAGAAAVVFNPDSVPADFGERAAKFGAVPIASYQPAVMLGHLAQQTVGNPARKLKLLAVTGTNGKTTTTFLLRGIFRAAGLKCGLIGTVQTDDCQTVTESSMTTPAPVDLAALLDRMVKNGAQAAAMEASSHALAQDRLAGLNFSVAMFSNLTGDHLDYHGTMENYAQAKARLFADLRPEASAVINADDPWNRRMVQDCRARILTYALDRPADFTGRIHRLNGAGMDIELSGPQGQSDRVRSSMVGRHNAQNLLCAVAGAWAAGLQWQDIIPGLEKLDHVPGRLEAVRLPGISPHDMPFHVLVDYAHTHDALQNVLSAVRPWTRNRIILVFGCGGDRDVTKRPKMAGVAEQLADDIFLTQDNPRNENPQDILNMILTGFSETARRRVHICPDRREAIGAAIEMARPGDVVLIAGKGHENYQIIGTVKHPFDDLKTAAAALHRRLTDNAKVRQQPADAKAGDQ